MKKFLVFLVALMAVVGVMGIVVGDEQVIEGEVPEIINFTLITTNLNYGSVIPGSQSEVKETIVTINENNNVDFNIDITLTDAHTSNIFENIYLESTTTPDTYTDQLLENVAVMRFIEDTDAGTSFDETFKSVLKAPIESDPISGATGTVTYTISATQP